MTEPIDITSKRIARRRAADAGAVGITPAQIAADIEARRAHDQACIERGLAIPPCNTWEEVAAWVDEGTWQRILGEHTGDARRDLERIRPAATEALPTPAATAVDRLMRANRTNPLVRRTK